MGKGSIDNKPFKEVLPSHSKPLSERDFAEALKICDWVNTIIRERAAYLRENALDAAINHPAANWSLEQSFFDGYRALSSKKYENINMLRVFSQIFSGHYLGVKTAHGLPVPKVLPTNLDEEALSYLVEAIKSEAPWWLIRYNKLILQFPELARLSPPVAFGETGISTGNAVVNHDLYVYLERLALLCQSGLIKTLQQKARPIILEIGSGYGGLAYYIKQLIPQCVYVCLDLPESLIFSAIYLSRYFPDPLLLNEDTDLITLTDHDCVFMPNYMFHKLVQSNLKIDLAINTLSMSEMTSDQVSYYCDGLKLLLGRDGKFFEQNHDNGHLGMIYAKDIVSQYFNCSSNISIHTDLTQGLATVWSN